MLAPPPTCGLLTYRARVSFDYRRNTRPLRWRTRDAFAPPFASIDANFFGDDASDFTDLSPRETCRPVGKPVPRVEPTCVLFIPTQTAGLQARRRGILLGH